MSNLQTKSTELEHLIVSQGSIKNDLITIETELRKALASAKKGYGVVISGDSGSGKTTLLTKFQEKAKGIIDEGDTPASVVYMETPENPVGKDLFEAMLEAAGTPFESVDALTKLKERQQKHEIKKLIENKNIRVWIFDEFQQATEKWGDKKVRQTADFLKIVLNNYPILLVFSGTEKVKKLLDNEQFESRSKLIEKKSLHIDSLTTYNAYLDYLATLQTHLNVTGVDWDSAEIALPVFYESRGDLRKITDILQTALIHAHMVGSRKLLKKHFVDSWVARYKPAQNEEVFFKSNTFKQNIDKLVDALRIKYDVD